MGKYKFRLSDMMPNAWFYKLKDMRKIRSTKPNSRGSNNTSKPSFSPSITQTTITSKNTTNNSLNSRNSFVYCATSAGNADYINSRFTDPLFSSPRNCSRASDARSSGSPCRKSSHSRTRSRRTTIYKHKDDSFCSADQPVYYSLSSSELGSPEPDSAPNNCYRKSVDFGVELVMFDELGSWSSSSLRSSCSCCCRISSSTADIIIDLNNHHNQTREESTFSKKFQKLKEFDAASELELRPILTKLPVESDFDEIDTSELGSAIRKSVVKAPSSLGHNNKNVGELKSRRPSLTDSFAVVMSSVDPQRDFKDSMMEMISENNLRGFKDLENLLACYLSLNCKEYHPLIVNAFEQIWLDVFCST